MRIGVLRLAAMLGFVFASIMVTQSPAGAEGGDCNNHAAGYGNTFVVCVSSGDGRVGGRGEVVNIYGATVSAQKTIYVQECRGNVTGCHTIAANSENAPGSLFTSSRVTSFGHIYRTCGSAGGAINVCSDWVTA